MVMQSWMCILIKKEGFALFWFKKKEKLERKCFHSYSLVDYYSYFSESLDLENEYEIRCKHCFNKRNVDEHTLNKLKELKLMEV